VLRECYTIAQVILNDGLQDNTHGSTHYVTAACYEHAPPAWATGHTPVCTIGQHVFFAAVK